MQTTRTFFSDKNLLLIFTYAAAGLGHLRVTDALYEGLPDGVSPLLFGSRDTSITTLHRITSIHPLARAVAEWMQRGSPENVFTLLYRWYLRLNIQNIYSQLVTLIDGRLETPHTIVIICTHFGLAHQLTHIKNRISRDRRVKVYVVLQVTDDSPQHIWYVPGADLIIVPSEKTKADLQEYAREANLSKCKIAVLPYPVSTRLGQKLSSVHYKNRVDQLSKEEKSPIHVCIPVSGAAVGLAFFTRMIYELHNRSSRFTIHIVAKSSAYTRSFLQKHRGSEYVKVYESPVDKKVVDLYEQLYENVVISLEITKPSEQAFKVLVSSCDVGGSLLLLSHPVGRQEYDNLDFMERHHLIPLSSEHEFIASQVALDKDLSLPHGQELIQKASHWRGIKISDSAQEAAQLVWWGIRSGLFRAMMNCRVKAHDQDQNPHELAQDGVKQFWQEIKKLIMTS